MNVIKVALTFSALLAFLTSSYGQDVRTGLILATPLQLQGIPLASSPYAGTELPPSVDLSADLPPVGDQGHESSCVGWATAYLKTWQERREEGWSVSDGDSSHVFSPAFVYNQINHGMDGGASFIDALRLVSELGAASLDMMPYHPGDYLSKPSSAALQSATRYRINTWRQVNVQDPRELKAHLNAGYPVLIGALVDDGFMHLPAGQSWKGQIGVQRGGHAMLMVGYDDSKNAFRIVNSWTPSWSEGGFGWIDYNYFPVVVREAYVAQDARNGPTPVVVGPSPQPGPPSPTTTKSYEISVQHVLHNIQYGQGFLDKQFCVTGNFHIHGVQATSAQIVVKVYFSASGNPGLPVMASSPKFATAKGEAVTGTPKFQISTNDFSDDWWACLPYQYLKVPSGIQNGQPMITTQLIMQPQLFINDFGVANASPVPFTVTW
ncbi:MULTISPECIES: C1 family peptidase [unclassified Bradyrhizobium]|uniref:C1 family peptidase n=1 Tax=unclassified Bradyrhizobium TaxID=2631580 RepID=UPI0028EF3254|nr:MULTISPECIES: C1 family peptidase [unclassified Bradyrhizobium]